MTFNLNIFSIISGAVSIYTLMCVIRVFMTWIPGAEQSAFGRFLSGICDPYLNLFKNAKFLRFGAFDISPMLALAVLWAASCIFDALAGGGALTVSFLVKTLLALVWNIIENVLLMIIIFFAIRLIIMIFSKSTYGTIWDAIDRSFTPILFKMAAPFYRNRAISFKGALIIGIIECIVLKFVIAYAFNFLIYFASAIPF